MCPNSFSDASTISFIEKILIIVQLQVYLFNKECLVKKGCLMTHLL